MGSKGRAVLHSEVIPKFASFFHNGDRIVEVGKHIFWDYKPFFFNAQVMCKFMSIDMSPGLKDQQTQAPLNYKLDDITASKLDSDSVEGFLFIGMHDNVSNPEKAYSEIYRILKPGGRILVAFPGSGAQCGGRVTGMTDFADYLKDFMIDDVIYVYGPENSERYGTGENTSILVIARKPL